jgi:hypothetical protein
MLVLNVKQNLQNFLLLFPYILAPMVMLSPASVNEIVTAISARHPPPPQAGKHLLNYLTQTEL